MSLIRLETQLQIKDAQFKQLRRLILDWGDLKYSKKQFVVAKIVQRMRLKGKGSEIFQNLMAMKLLESMMISNEKSTSTLKESATVGGAYVGSKLVHPTKNKLGSKTGAGIGAYCRLLGKWS